MAFTSRKQLMHIVALAALTAGIICPSAVADDSQYWNEFVFNIGLSDSFDMKVASEQYFTDNMSDFSLYNFTVAPSYDLSGLLSVSLGYRYERQKDDADWLDENRYFFSFTLKNQMGEWKTRITPKLEYRDLEDKDAWRFRGKIKVQRSMKAVNTTVTPFISDEPFYDFENDQWNQNRAAAGLSLKLTDNIELSLYYMNIQKKSGNEWNETHVAGTEMVFGF